VILAKLASIEAQCRHGTPHGSVQAPRPFSSSWRSPQIRHENVRQLRRFLHDDAEKSKPLLSRHIGQLILNPKETLEGPVYEVSGDTDLLPARSDVMQMVARAGSRSQCLPARSTPSRGAARPESASAKSSMDPRLKRCTTNPACRRTATSHTRHYRAAEPRSGLHGRSQEARRARRLRTGRY